MINIEDQLKNPVWFSLIETHRHIAVAFDGVQFYDPCVCNFGAFFDETKTKSASNAYIKTSNEFFFVSENRTPIVDHDQVSLVKKVEGCQMVLNKLTDIEITEEIVLLDETFIDAIYNLVCLVMPGYYKRRTFEMGNYYGIFKDGKLVSLAGQRMQTNLFIEVSAVVTHPNYTQKGFARQLIAHNTKEILKVNKQPILHTNKGNLAIPLYKKLGFELTRDMNWWLYRKK